MPGTIQVTVLEFKGVSYSSKPSAKSVKVSMGKRHYQTWDKGEFSFAIMKLREDLVVALLDAGGNEIARTDIRTMQIMEKGSWDEVFPINGGGHVHMKLQFILNEEERNRIRVVRESAVKRKLEANPSINLRLLGTVDSTLGSAKTSTEYEQKVSDSQKGIVEIDVMRNKVEASQAGLSLTSAASSALSLSSYQKEGPSIVETAIPVKELGVNATDGSQSAPCSPGRNGIEKESPQLRERVPDEKIESEPIANLRLTIWDKNNSVPPKLQDDPVRKSKIEGPVKKTSSNVMKMISAFENSKLQEVKSLKKAASVPSQLNRFRNDGESNVSLHPPLKRLKNLKDQFTGNLLETRTTSSGTSDNIASDSEPSQASKEFASTMTAIPSRENDSNIEDMPTEASRESTMKKLEMRQSTSETAESSGEIPNKQSRVTQAYELTSEMLSPPESSVAEGSGSGRGRETSLKSSTMINIEVAPNPKPDSPEYFKEEYYSAQSSGMWIFPDNTRRLCITTAGKQVMITGCHNDEDQTHHLEEISSESEVLEENLMHGTKCKVGKDQREIVRLPESGCGNSPSDSSNGLLGQVIKVAVIFGFGVLVLLTRQKEPRKKHKEENKSLFPVTNYIDERTSKPWPRLQLKD